MKNDFAVFLDRVIRDSGIKKQSVADAVGYDLSYISKWLGGKALPSNKSIVSISQKIAGVISAECSSDNQLYAKCGIEDRQQMEAYISEGLVLAFTRSRGVSKTGREKTAEYYQELPLADALKLGFTLQERDASDIAMLVDILAMNHEDRLLLLGIRDGSFVRTQYRPDVRISMILDLNSMSDVIYDTLSIIHLISGFSYYSYRLFSSPSANQKCCVSSLSNLAVSGFLFPGDRNITFATVSENSGDIDASYRKMLSLCHQDDLLFRKTKIHEFIISKDYVRSMLSENIRWVFGHITELILPGELFKELLDAAKIENKEDCLRIHAFSQDILDLGETKIMMYETAVSDMLATGEVDFFNHRVVLTPEQKRQCLDYWKALNQTEADFCFIEGGFSHDFQHIYSPCIFISDSSSYIRLENAYDRESVAVCVHQQMRQLLIRFFDAAWRDRNDVVIHDKRVIQNKLVHYSTMAEMLN